MRILGLALLLVLVASGLAWAGADRMVVEDAIADAGSFTATSQPTWLRDNGSLTTLRPHTCASNKCTRAAPTGDLEGMMLGAVGSYVVTVAIDAGTFVDGGVCETWAYNPDGFSGQKWGYVQGKDLTPTSNQSSVRFPTQENDFAAPGWRLVIRCNEVGTSTAAPSMNVQTHACKNPGCDL